MRRRVFWTTTAVVGVVLVVVAILILVGARLIAVSSTRSTMVRQAEAIEQIVTTAVAQAVADGDLPAVRELFDNPGSRPEVRRVLTVALQSASRVAGDSDFSLGFIDRQGRFRPLGSPGEPVNPADFGIDVGRLEAGESQVIRGPRGSGDQTFMVVARPFEQLDDIVLIVVRGVPVLSVADFWIPLALIFVGAAALAAILARWISGWVSGRLSGLAAAAQQLADGDTAARAPVEGEDEVAEVARSFNDMAERLGDARRREQDFLMSVGHDLRTPLTTLGGYAEAIEEGSLAGDDLERAGTVMAAETLRLRRLVDDLMLLARLEAREFSLEPEPVDLSAHLGEVVEGFRHRAVSAKVQLEADLDDVGVVMADPDRIAQIVGNLVENALRYTPELGAVAVSSRADDDLVVVEVADTGPGIDSADLPRVFERFYVARKYRGVRPSGSGLGLSIVQQLVRVMGGEVSASTNKPHGTVVRVEVPKLAP